MAPRQDCELFLRSLNDKIRTFGIVIRDREKNFKALTELEITGLMREEYIKNIKIEDYSSGPNRESNGEPDYWVFGIMVKGSEVYVKVAPGVINKPVDCMSFHIAEHTLPYPYKN